MDLHAFTIGHSPLTDTIYLYRTGKRPGPALDKRPITGGKPFAITVKPLPTQGTTKGGADA